MPPSTLARTILIADPFESLVSVIARVLNDRGFSVIPATGAIQAIELTNRFLPEIALVDSEMTAWRGIPAYQLMQETHPGVTIVLMTNLHSGYSPECSENVAASINKPFRIAELLEILNRLPPPSPPSPPHKHGGAVLPEPRSGRGSDGASC